MKEFSYNENYNIELEVLITNPFIHFFIVTLKSIYCNFIIFKF